MLHAFSSTASDSAACRQRKQERMLCTLESSHLVRDEFRVSLGTGVVRRCWQMALIIMTGNVVASLVAFPHSATRAERDPLVASFLY